MGRQKLGNGNAMRNNNEKKMQERHEVAEFASYAEQEAQKLESGETKK